MNFDNLPETQIVYTTTGSALEDILLVLGFVAKRQHHLNTYVKDELTIVIATESSYVTRDAEEAIAILRSMAHNTPEKRAILVIQAPENTGGGWITDKTGKRISRNFNDLQKVGVTYDDVINPRHLWKFPIS